MYGLKIILLLVLIAGCKEGKTIMKIQYYNHGELQFPMLNVDLQNEILTLTRDLISNSSDILKLLVNDSRIEEIKQNEVSIEIIFEEHNLFTSDELGTEKVNKILFPLSGDFIGNTEDPVITIFLGDESYFSGPYRNEKGFDKLMELKKIVVNGIQEN
jgi:hypothetical protein